MADERAKEQIVDGGNNTFQILKSERLISFRVQFPAACDGYDCFGFLKIPRRLASGSTSFKYNYYAFFVPNVKENILRASNKMRSLELINHAWHGMLVSFSEALPASSEATLPCSAVPGFAWVIEAAHMPYQA